MWPEGRESNPELLARRDPDLAVRLDRFLTEPVILQDGSLPRKEWLEALEEALNEDSLVTTVILDIVGGRSLSESGRFPVVMTGVIETVCRWGEGVITRGRSVNQRESPKVSCRHPGEDEILLFFNGSRFEEAAQKMDGLQQSIEQTVGNQVHLGACHVSRNINNTDASQVLAVADYALRKAKEKARENGDLSPRIGEMLSGNTIMIDGETIEVAPDKGVIYPPQVVTENTVAALRMTTGPFTAVTPCHMRLINREGRGEGDKVLLNVAEEISRTMEDGKIYKIGTVFMVKKDIPFQGLWEMGAVAPYGLAYDYYFR